MNYAFHNEDYVIPLRTVVDGEEVAPASGNITWTLYDINHAILASGLVASSSPFPITIPAANNQKVLATELRFVTYTFTYGGLLYSNEYTYRVIDRVPLLSSDGDIAVLFGLSLEDIQELGIDIYAAYEAVQNRVSGDLSARLKAGGVDSRYWNEAIKQQAAINLIPTLKLAVMQKETQDNIGQSRFNVDFDAIEESLYAKLYDNINHGVLNSSNTIGLSSIATKLASFPAPTDPITGQ